MPEFSVQYFLDIFGQGISVLLNLAPIWIPILLLAILRQMWVGYLQARAIAKKDWIMLEVRLPRNIERSPLGMELVLNALHYKGDVGDMYRKYWKGNITPWTSLEIVSFEGDIHFFVRMERGQKRHIESQIYAQYPDVEIFEVEDDYATNFQYDEDKYSMWMGEFTLTRPDPYPIKTYIDYGLERGGQEEEEKVDPMTPMMEWLGSLEKGEQAWIQIVARFHLDNRKKKGEKWFEFKDGALKWKGGWFATESSWKEDATKEVEDIKKKATIEPKEGGTPRIELSSQQKDTITALERSVTKPGFDVGIRGAYIAEQDVFTPSNIGGLIGSFKAYSSGGLNGFKPTNTPAYTYPWQDPRKRREARNKRMLLDAYKRRSFFHPPYKRKPFVLNTEELATIYHFPGRVVTTPTVKRIESRKAEPPSNLPR